MRRPPSIVALISCGLLAAACSGEPGAPADAAAPDGSAPIDLALGEVAGPVFASFSFGGCPNLDAVDGHPRCSGPAPMVLSLVPITPPGANAWVWTIQGGLPDTWKDARPPSVTWTDPGTFVVTLVIGAPGGTASATGEVDVLPVGLGGPCTEPSQCAPLGCLCARPDAPTDGGLTCPGALAEGLCTRSCAGAACDPGAVCADLSRSAAHDAEVGAVPWRHPLCVPACATSADCRPGTSCRELPALAPGALAGGAFTWRKGCFADVLGDLGAPCLDGGGRPLPSSCVSGSCASLGARGICTLPCGPDPCPPEAVCATLDSDRAHPICIPRCDGMRPCGDPLLVCAATGAKAAVDFSVPISEAHGLTYCAPRRCAASADCAPAGSCVLPDGGVGTCRP